ncbi:diacylglycerol/lipid kinase family protein [Algoriphagus namhaensis]
MKLFFIVNPISGGVDKEPFLQSAVKLCQKYGIDFHIFKTSGEQDEQKVKQELKAFKPDKVVSVGGDGTTLFSALALIGSDCPMGIVPLGSANGMATELCVSPKPMSALKDIILSQTVAGLDLLKINDQHYSIHIGDVGINAQIVEAYEADPNRGMGTYAKYFIEALTRIKPFAVEVKIDDTQLREKVLMVGICNARKYGTGVPLSLEGNPMDGVFELVLITEINSKSLVKAGLSTFDENFFDHQARRVLSGKSAELIFDSPRLLQLDGEVIGKFDHLKIKMLAGAIKLITNGDNIYLENQSATDQPD